MLSNRNVDFDGADQQRQEDWVNSVFAAADTGQASLEAGLIGAHFHVSLDGARILNLAEWTTADAHRQAITAPAPRLRTTTQQFPGATGIAVHRFTPYRSMTSPG